MRDSWGKIVVIMEVLCGKKRALRTRAGLTSSFIVNKRGAFTISSSHGFLHLSTWFFIDFVSVGALFLPIINRTNNDDNELNKPILLSGGCV